MSFWPVASLPFHGPHHFLVRIKTLPAVVVVVDCHTSCGAIAHKANAPQQKPVHHAMLLRPPGDALAQHAIHVLDGMYTIQGLLIRLALVVPVSTPWKCCAQFSPGCVMPGNAGLCLFSWAQQRHCTLRFCSTQACTLLVLWQYFQISSCIGGHANGDQHNSTEGPLDSAALSAPTGASWAASG